MKKTLLGMAFLTFGFVGLSQNLIFNPSFEDGTLPNAKGQIEKALYWTDDICTDIDPMNTGVDLLDRYSTITGLKVPTNFYGSIETFYGLGGSEIDNRYAHIYQRKTDAASPSPNEYQSEVLKGTIDGSLEAGCYEFRFMAARANASLSVNGTPILPNTNSTQQIKVSLVNGNNCTGLVIFTTPVISNDINGNSQWNEYLTSVTIPSQSSGLYNRIIFEFVKYGTNSELRQDAYIDHVVLEKYDDTVTITGNDTICVGSFTTLTASTGFDNYLWSNNATSQFITVNAAGTYTVEAWNNGDVCHAFGSITVVSVAKPKVLLPKQMAVCAGNFRELCGPIPIANYNFGYSWFYNNTVTQQFDLVSSNACYTPTQYGEYTLIVTNQYGCATTRVIDIVEGFGPAFNIDDIYYGCGAKAPKYVGLPAAPSDALSYDWTYDDGSGPISYASSNDHQILNLGDGIYCVTITWSDANNPSLLGCTSTACFKVQECCAPNPEFSIQWTPGANTGTITVNNIPANTVNYTYEQFTLYKNCNNTGWVNAGLPTVARTSNFNSPIVFNNLDKNCIYKVIHIVKSECLNMDFTYTGYAYGKLMVSIYPNPAIVAAPVTIEMTSLSEKSTVEISDIETGELIFTGVLEYDQPLTVAYDVFPRKRGEAGSLYSVKISNSKETITEKILVR